MHSTVLFWMLEKKRLRGVGPVIIYTEPNIVQFDLVCNVKLQQLNKAHVHQSGFIQQSLFM